MHMGYIVLQLSGSFQIVIVYCLLPLTDTLHPYSREIIIRLHDYTYTNDFLLGQDSQADMTSLSITCQTLIQVIS